VVHSVSLGKFVDAKTINARIRAKSQKLFLTKLLARVAVSRAFTGSKNSTLPPFMIKYVAQPPIILALPRTPVDAKAEKPLLD
jgi:hypothetical protein